MSLFTQTLLLSILVGATVPLSSGAAVIERDWLAPGDGLLTYDTVNQREWLDVTETILSFFSDSIITDEATAVAKLELLPGGALEGFTLASRQAVEELVASAGVDLSTTQRAQETADDMRALIRLIETSEGSALPGQGGVVKAIIDEMIVPEFIFENANVAAILVVSSPFGSAPFGEANMGFATNTDSYRVRGTTVNFVGLMVYRDAVPEPGTISLVGLVIVSPSVRIRAKR